MKKKNYKFVSNTHKQSVSYTNKTFDQKNKYNFKNTLLNHSKFQYCEFNGINFKRAAVTGSVFENCKFFDCNFDDADFEFCEFRNCEINIKKIDGCSFNNSNFIISTFDDILFINCTFTSAYFEQSIFCKTNIEYSTLEGACFTKCIFKNLDWRSLNLEYVEFIKPSMSNVVLPFFQIPYMFGILQYLANTDDSVYISHNTSTITLDTYFESGIPFLLDEYKKQELYFPMSNIYLFGRNADYNKAYDCLARELSAISMTRDFREIKFCCKLISMSHMFNRKQLNKFYKIINDIDVSFKQDSAEMKSFVRNIGEIRNILFSRKKVPEITIKIRANIGIEYSLRFSNLIHQFQKIAKPNNTDKVYTSFKLAQNSPLLINVNVYGDVSLFSPILKSFLILTGVPVSNCYDYPLINSLQLQCKDTVMIQDTVKSIVKCHEELKHDGIELELMEYYVECCDELLQPGDKNYYINKRLLAISAGGTQDEISGI